MFEHDRGSAGIDPRAGEASAVRPFIRQEERPPAPAIRPLVHTPVPEGVDGTVDGGAGVRPYYLTGGRVGSADRRVRVETIVVARPGVASRLPGHAVEHRRLVSLAVGPVSVAELSVAMAVPVGVVLVLAGDLAREGLIDVSTPAIAPRDDVELIRRLIDGVIAL